MINKILLTAGLMLITPLSQSIAMDDQKPETPQTSKSKAERNKEDAYRMWASRQAEGHSTFGITQLPPELASKIGNFSQENDRFDLTCPSSEEIQKTIENTKEGNYPIFTDKNNINFAIITKFENLENDSIKNVIFTQVVLPETNLRDKGQSLMCYYNTYKEGHEPIRTEVMLNHSAYIDEYKILDKPISKERGDYSTKHRNNVYLSKNGYPEDIVFTMVKK